MLLPGILHLSAVGIRSAGRFSPLPTRAWISANLGMIKVADPSISSFTQKQDGRGRYWTGMTRSILLSLSEGVHLKGWGALAGEVCAVAPIRTGGPCCFSGPNLHTWLLGISRNSNCFAVFCKRLPYGYLSCSSGKRRK